VQVLVVAHLVLAALAVQLLLVDQEVERVLYFQVFPPLAMMMKAQQGLLGAGLAMLEVLLQLSLLPGMQQVRARLAALLLAHRAR
jgi:hypothetical protein